MGKNVLCIIENSVSQMLFACGPPLSLIYLCGHLVVDAVPYKKLFYFHIVDICIRMILLLLFTILFPF
jgi:hypothetical protein